MIQSDKSGNIRKRRKDIDKMNIQYIVVFYKDYLPILTLQFF